MTGLFGLDWAIQAMSLFNVILLIWLGLTVLLNAERRTGGILLSGGGLLMGGAFFISHSALLSHDINVITSGQDFWWYLGWAPVVCLPLAWYGVMLWYAGFWEARQAEEAAARRLYHRHRFGFALTLLFGSFLVGLLFFARLLPSFSQLALSRAVGAASPWGIFPLAMIYPLYALLCMGLSLDALRRPGPSQRWLGELARRRAQPWLWTTSLLLLVVSLLVGWAMIWIVLSLGRGVFTIRMVTQIGVFDLIIAGIIGLAVMALGQAIVSYEIFTARTLPRNGLMQHWRRAVLLAVGYSVLVAWTLTARLEPIYSLLLTTLLMTVFFAMLAWRSYAERERLMRHLRPFLVAPEVYPSILDTRGEDAAMDVSATFQSLCSEILETHQACLAPLGEMASLAGPAVLFPNQNLPEGLSLAPLAAEFHSPEEKGMPLDPLQHQGYIWAIPLWSERGLMGVLLLGEKRTEGLYSLEEIEIARAAGERLVDLKASAELARRLAILERQHLSQNQVMDQQARRVLHDETLPLVHTALLQLSGAAGQGAVESVELLTQVHRQLSDLLRSTAATLSPDVKHLGFLGALRQVVERDLAGALDRIDWQVEPSTETQIQRLRPLESEVLFFAAREALRNAARYGRSENGEPLQVIIRMTGEAELRLIIEDNGNGMEPDAGKTAPTSAKSSGQGLALHSAMMAVIGGSLSLDHAPGLFTRVTLSLPGVSS